MRLRPLIALGLLPLLSACTDFALRDLRGAQFTGTAFQQALAMEYRTLSEDDAANYNWADSQRHAEQGLIAAYGQDVPPTEPAARDLSAEKRPGLDAAYARLRDALGSDAKNSAPKNLAHAQSQYECWLQKQAYNVNEADIATCRENFEEAIGALSQKDLAAAGTAVEPPAGAPQDFYVLLFRLGSARLDVSGKARLQEIAASLKSESAYHIVLNGHTDRTGTEDFNLKLSESRARSVKAALAEAGLDAARIDVFAFGETDPKVPTADGVEEPRNRRVEILLN